MWFFTTLLAIWSPRIYGWLTQNWQILIVRTEAIEGARSCKCCVRANLVYRVSLANWGQNKRGKYRRNQYFCFDTDSAVLLHVFQWYLNKIKCNLGTSLSF